MMEFTAVFRKVPEGYLGFIEELCGGGYASVKQGLALLQSQSLGLHGGVSVVRAIRAIYSREDRL